MKPRIATALLAGTAALAFAGSPSVAAATEPGTCDVVASPSGSDSAAGTAEQPVRSAVKLLSIVPEGGTACLRAGTYADDDQIKVAKSGVTLTSYAGETATLKGRLWLVGDGDTVSGLSLDGVNDHGLPSPSVTGDDAVLSDNDITNDHTGICVSLGAEGYGEPDGTLIADNRIHDCGRVNPTTNFDHGIYVAYATNTDIRGNYILDNADRGIQLYPHAVGTHVHGNVIDGNGEGVLFSGESSDNVVENNIISNSKVRFNVESYWEGAPGHNNDVHDNCLWSGEQGNVQDPSVGFNAYDNLVASPNYSSSAKGSFEMSASGPCAAILNGSSAPTSGPGNGGGHSGGGAQGGVVHHGPGVALQVTSRRALAQRAIKLRGEIRSGTPTQSRAVIETRRAGHWRRVAFSDIRDGHSFNASVRVADARRSKHVYRAVVPGVGHSKLVRVHVSR